MHSPGKSRRHSRQPARVCLQPRLTGLLEVVSYKWYSQSTTRVRLLVGARATDEYTFGKFLKVGQDNRIHDGPSTNLFMQPPTKHAKMTFFPGLHSLPLYIATYTYT